MLLRERHRRNGLVPERALHEVWRRAIDINTSTRQTEIEESTLKRTCSAQILLNEPGKCVTAFRYREMQVVRVLLPPSHHENVAHAQSGRGWFVTAFRGKPNAEL